MKTVNVSLVGVGGQGILLTSDILAKTAALAGLDVKKSEVHGMAQRGGSVISQVRFGDKVYSPIISDGTSDLLVSFERLEALRWRHLLAPTGKVLINDMNMTPVTVSSGQQAAVSRAAGSHDHPGQALTKKVPTSTVTNLAPTNKGSKCIACLNKSKRINRRCSICVP